MAVDGVGVVHGQACREDHPSVGCGRVGLNHGRGSPTHMIVRVPDAAGGETEAEPDFSWTRWMHAPPYEAPPAGPHTSGPPTQIGPPEVILGLSLYFPCGIPD